MKRIAWYLATVILVVTTLMATSCRAPTAEKGQGKVVSGKVTEKAAPAPGEKAPTPVPVEKGPTYGGTLTILSAAPINWSPNAYSMEGEKGMYMEKLMFWDWAADRTKYNLAVVHAPWDVVKGMLVESWEVASDLKSVTFHVRKGVRWQNKYPVFGREMTAQDIKYSYDRLLGTGSGFTEPSKLRSFPEYRFITSVEAPDKYTIVFRLKQYTYEFLEFHGFRGGHWIYPPELVQAGDEDWHNAVGTGPFMLKDFVVDSSLTLVKNPDYWGYDELHPNNRLPYVDKVVGLIVPDISTQIAALRTGKLDQILTVNWEQAQQLKKTNPQLISRPYRAVCLTLQMRNDKAPFTDIRVRKAMQM